MALARFLMLGCAVALAGCAAVCPAGREASFAGLDLGMGNLYRTSKAETRSICPENFTGEKGMAGMAVEGTGQNAARELGRTWKVSPSVVIKAGTTFTLAEIAGPGCIQQIWMTPTGNWRASIVRFFWDDEPDPSIECPVGDFFACGWGKYCQINSLAVCVNPGSAFNCYWQMPFRKKARITMENIDAKDMVLYYQINYVLTEIPQDAAYLHAQFRREDPLAQKGTYTIVDGIEGKGQYVGTYMAWEVHSPGWWGEGEIKFFMDGDKEFPTICGTGTEDYFCGSYNFENRETKRYQQFSTPYAGLPQVLPPDKIYEVGQRFGLYRWHVLDPIRFKQDLKVTIQALGWQSGGRYLPLEDDISSVAFWYQTEPHKKFPPLPGRDALKID
ncbi:MAG: hypothetical protein BWX69_02073 [Planctomycetes bacterium ADurb.Bin069]|jgi:hypothetical protein|nr:MAG: hypothetical protein BWX69_02073 [Planctomycetes bacterium ADurb.Bin069]